MNTSHSYPGTPQESEAADASDSATGAGVSYADDPVQADHIGALLCATRMRAGGDLQDIARILKIRYSYLVAIEDSRFEDLPGTAYSIGFVRAYADYLGLDGDTVVRRLREEMSGAVQPARFEFSVHNVESGLPNGGLLAIAVAFGMVVYGGWFVFTNEDRNAVDLIQEVPGRLAQLVDSPNPPDAEALVSDQPAAVTETVLAEGELTPAIEVDRISVLDDGGTDTNAEESPAVTSDTQNTGNETEVEIAQQPSVAGSDSQGQLDASVIVAEAVPAQESSPPVIPANTALRSEAVAEGVRDSAEVGPTPDLAEETADPPGQSEGVTARIGSSESPDNATPSSSEPIALLSSEDNAEPDMSVALDTAASGPPDVASDATQSREGEGPDQSAPLEADEVTAAVEQDVAATDDSQLVAVANEPVPEASSPASDEQETEIASADTVNTTIELRAKSDSWIQVRDGNELLLTRLLRKGEVYRVPDREGLTLMTGNAGGLEVIVGGDLAPPLGNEGVVRRGVPLNADSLRAGLTSG